MSRREDTCIGKPCPFWKRYGDKCPNYVEGVWESKELDRYTTKDCAPKRAMLLTQQMYDHIIGTRRDFNQMRNASVQILQLAACQTGVPLVVEGEIEEPKQIEETTDGKDTGK